MAKTYWGVDSAAPVTNQLYECVTRNLGKPAFWGRYLVTIPNVTSGLTAAEIAFLHGKGIKILPIYNQFRSAVGYDKGRIAAGNAIGHAQRLGIPKGVPLFANVERFFNVDAAWIRGWTDAILASGYRSGMYHDPVRGGFSHAFCVAAQHHPRVKSDTYLWSAEPEPGPTSEANAPRYNPARTPCGTLIYAWQYGRDAAVCPVDTNLMQEELFRLLW